MEREGGGDASTDSSDPPSSGNDPAGVDPFDLLGLPARFDLEPSEIDRVWVRLAAASHPDRAGDPVAAAESARRAAELNEARSILRDPERRASRLLERLGGPGAGEERGLPPSFLEEMMELRERVEDAVADRDPTSRREIEREVVVERDARITRVAGLFVDADGDPERLREIRLELNVWRYHERLLSELRGAVSAR